MKNTRAPALATAMSVIAALVLVGTPGSAAAAATCEGRAATIVGNPDVLTPNPNGEPTVPIVGTEGDDVIVGTDLDDVIDALGGNDLVCAGPGADIVRGGAGNDRLFGEEDNETGDREGDRIWLGDEIEPGPGDDYVDAGAEPRNHLRFDWDVVSYADSTVGIVADLSSPTGLGKVTDEGTDTVVVPATGISLWASAHDDVVVGGPGDDWLNLDDGADRADGRGGDDTIDLDDYDDAQGHGIDTAKGGTGDDIITSAAGRDYLSGGSGDDSLITGKDGAALLRGQAGDDALSIEQHTDALTARFPVSGGPGSDFIDVALPGRRTDVTVDVDHHRLVVAGRRTLTMSSLEDFQLLGRHRWTFLGTDRAERVVLDDGIGRLVAHLEGGDDRAKGGNGSDFIDAGDGRDWVRGSAGEDTCLRAEDVRCEVTEGEPRVGSWT